MCCQREVQWAEERKIPIRKAQSPQRIKDSQVHVSSWETEGSLLQLSKAPLVEMQKNPTHINKFILLNLLFRKGRNVGSWQRTKIVPLITGPYNMPISKGLWYRALEQKLTRTKVCWIHLCVILLFNWRFRLRKERGKLAIPWEMAKRKGTKTFKWYFKRHFKRKSMVMFLCVDDSKEKQGNKDVHLRKKQSKWDAAPKSGTWWRPHSWRSPHTAKSVTSAHILMNVFLKTIILGVIDLYLFILEVSLHQG